jgi:hypothetical protein
MENLETNRQNSGESGPIGIRTLAKGQIWPSISFAEASADRTRIMSPPTSLLFLGLRIVR